MSTEDGAQKTDTPYTDEEMRLHAIRTAVRPQPIYTATGVRYKMVPWWKG